MKERINNLCSVMQQTLPLLLWMIFPIHLYAQGKVAIKGKVIDGLTGNPVPAATVFINNTTYAQICDAAGVFTLDKFPEPPLELTITAVGYEATSRKIIKDNEEQIIVRLTQKVIGLEEVIIKSAEKDGWAKYGRQFLEDFIGYSPFATQCKLVNKEVLQFRYDQNSNSLKVWASEPLLIRNEATGYLITYWLEDFEKKYDTRKLYFKGYAQFTPLVSKKEKKMQEWTANRQLAYKGSLNHFMRSVYSGNAGSQGFEIRKLIRVKGEDYGRFVPVWTDTVLHSDSLYFERLFRSIFGNSSAGQEMIAAVSQEGFRKWDMDSRDTASLKITVPPVLPDTVYHKEYVFKRDKSNKERIVISYYDFNSISPKDSIAQKKMRAMIKTAGDTPLPILKSPSFDFLYKDTLAIDSFTNRKGHEEVSISFSRYLHITYIHENEEIAYFERQYPTVPINPDKQTSIISLSNDQGIIVYPNGNFAPSYDLLVEQYWSYEKLDKLLPLDYQP